MELLPRGHLILNSLPQTTSEMNFELLFPNEVIGQPQSYSSQTGS